MFQFNYGGQNGVTHNLVETQDMMIIRTINSFDPKILLSQIKRLQNIDLSSFTDFYPEASVYVFKFDGFTAFERDQVKYEIQALNHPNLKFVGTVLKREDNGVYQIYTGNLFIKFKNGTTRNDINALLVKYGLELKPKLHFNKKSFFVEPMVNKGKEIFILSQELLKEKSIELCHPELVVKRKTFNQVKQVASESFYDDWAAKMINLYDAWKITKGKGTKICIIDDGIELDHPSFNNESRQIKTKDMFCDDGGPATHKDDSEMHGTACASIAGGNDDRILGIAPEADLLIVRSKGLGSVFESEAIYWAVANGADIISCSWGPQDGEILNPNDNYINHPLPDHTRLAFEYAIKEGRNKKGCLILFAAGNGSESIDFDGYASNENVLAIGAVNKESNLTAYSDYGNKLFCCFPSSEVIFEGSDIKTIYGLPTIDRLGTKGYADGDYFAHFGGTSAACPGMAGVAALMLSINNELTLSECKELIKASCYYPSTHNVKDFTTKLGHGIINARTLLEYTQNLNNKNLLKMNNQNKKIAIHIAVDLLDNTVYQGEYDNLAGCKNDLKLFEEFTKGKYKQEILKDNEATRKNVLHLLEKTFSNCKEGDEIVFTYSGHGGSYADDNLDEKDGKDECLVLHDGLLMDDEIYDLHYMLPEGVKLFWYTDSCHSGSSTRGFKLDAALKTLRSKANNRGGDTTKYRQIESTVLRKVYENNKAEYDNKRNAIAQKQANEKSYKANIIHFAACLDYQFAAEINGYGLFSKTLTDIVKSNPNISYQSLFDQVKSNMPSTQIPVLSLFGNNTNEYLGQKFFDLGTTPFPSPKPLDVKYSNLEECDQLIFDEEKEINYNTIRKSKSRTNVASEHFQGSNIWDKAYNAILDSEKEFFVEPDLSSFIYAQDNDVDHRSSDTGYLETYPHPTSENGYDALWHLSDEHSQLRKAREEVLGEELLKNKRIHDKDQYPLIVHIDTGLLDIDEMQPLDLDIEASMRFRNYIDTKRLVLDQQGHGHATMAILAGGKLVFDGNTDLDSKEYFGAFPFARTVTLRISDSVVIFNPSSFTEALNYAVDVLKADVVTMSMGGLPSKGMAKAVNKAYENGVVVVTAAGNTWSRNIKKLLPNRIVYPARFDRVIAATGATLYQTPYQNKFNENWRAAGGDFMQASYGPKDAMRTAVAAYTPNLLWFSEIEEPFHRKSGGGTSSATPQIAAAAALYIFKYRDNNKIKNRNWERTETVRQAIFRSADKSYNGKFGSVFTINDKQYDQYYGNGILKAHNALQLSPDQIKLTANDMEKKADLGFTTLDEIAGLFGGFRGSKLKNKILNEMLALEVEQLFYTDPNLFQFADTYELTQEIKEKIYASPLASERLKQSLKYHLSHIPESMRNAALNINSTSRSFKIESGAMTIYTENLSKIRQVNGSNEKTGLIASFEIDLMTNINRGGEDSGIRILNNWEDTDCQTLIIATDENGIEHYSWVTNHTEGEDTFQNNNPIRGIKNSNGIININVNRSRSIFSAFKKFVVNVFRALNDEPVSKLIGLINGTIEYGQINWEVVSKNNELIAKMKKEKPEKILLLIHGTFSSVEDSFEYLLNNVNFLRKIQVLKYDRILGFNHSSIKSSITENVKLLENEIKVLGLNKNNFTVISASRGGLIARKVFAESNANLILSACPNFGTPMADKQNINQLLDRFTKLAALSGLNSPVIPAILYVVNLLAKNVWSFDGISDMAPDSPFISKLAPLTGKEILIGIDHNSKGIRSAIDLANDNLIFGGEYNDMVVPLDSSTNNLSNSAFYFRDISDTHHTNYFKNADISNYVISSIK